MPTTLRDVGFDEENIAADRCPGETDNHAGPLHALFDFLLQLELGRAKKLFDNLGCDDEPRIFTFQKPARMLAANIRDLTFEIAHTGFPRVMPNDVVKG